MSSTMRKSDKKIEKQLRVTLNEICEIALKSHQGFEWLTHLVNYNNFPKSLKIICVFDTNVHLDKFNKGDDYQQFTSLIQRKLFEEGITLKKINQHIIFETEENCIKTHDGKWHDKLQTLSVAFSKANFH